MKLSPKDASKKYFTKEIRELIEVCLETNQIFSNTDNEKAEFTNGVKVT